MTRIIIAFTFILFLSACTGSAYQLPQVTDEDMQGMQDKIDASKKPLKTYERSDQQYTKMLADISQRLRKNAKPLCEYAEYQSCYFQVMYNNEDTVNAYASEGSKITVYRGLLQYLKNNDEIAAVVAHEMGHHLAKHNEETEENMAAGAAVSGIITAVLLGTASANNPYYTPYQQQNQQNLENMVHVGAQIGALSYSKEQEREADLLATYILSRAGYNLQRAQNIMSVLASLGGEDSADSSAASFLDTHPAGIERFVAWEKAMEEVKTNSTKLPYLKESANNE